MIDDRLNGDSLLPEDGDSEGGSERFAERRLTAEPADEKKESGGDSEPSEDSNLEEKKRLARAH